MTSAELKTQIDSEVTNKAANNSVSPTNVGVNLKDVVDYVDQEKIKYRQYKVAVLPTSIAHVLLDEIGFSSAIVTNPFNGKITVTKTGVFTSVDVNKIDFIVTNVNNAGSVFIGVGSQGGDFGQDLGDKFTINLFDMAGGQTSTPNSNVIVEVRIYD